jgi:hypothetical protein
LGEPFFGVLANAFAQTFLFERSAAAVFAISILAAGKNLGQALVGVKRRCGQLELNV